MSGLQALTQGPLRLWRRCRQWCRHHCQRQLDTLNNCWQHIDPRWRLRLTVGISTLVTLALAYPIFFAEPPESIPTAPKKPIRHVFTDSDTRQVGIDEALSEMHTLRQEVKTFDETLQRLREQERHWQEEGQRQAQTLRQQTETLARLEQQLEQNTPPGGQNDGLSSVTSVSNPKPGKAWREQQTGRQATQLRANTPLLPTETDDPFQQPWYGNDRRNTGQDDVNPANTAPVPVMRSLVAPSQPSEPDNNDPALDLPLVAGSLISGVLINGLDAPTSPDTRDHPHPVLVRIQKEAILPNEVLTDIRECFMIFAGFGDMSTERAYLRSESLSCVREDLTTLETQIDSYLVGEDGKAGIRGRLVTKQGKAMALAMMSGFLGGIAKAFDVKPVPVLSTQSNPQVQYQQLFSTDLLKGSAFSGAGQALDKVAQFYIQMAEGMFPVVEVDAGRQVDIIVKRFGPLSQPRGVAYKSSVRKKS